MKRILWIAGGLVGLWVAVALALDAWVGLRQPQLQPGTSEGVLYTFDSEGARQGTRLAVVDDGDTVWIQSGHHFRGWYWRLLEQPHVELERGGETRPYTAVPVNTPEAREKVSALLRERAGPARFALVRAVLLWAEIKPVRLDPR